jgi:hypothetical protein
VPFEEAKSLAGGEARLRRGIKPSTFSNWKKLGVPWNVLGPILVERSASSAQEPQPSYGEPWADPEWQAIHAFTALVEALRQLDIIPTTSPSAWKGRVAWEAIAGASEFIQMVADWKDQDWERIYRKRLDHWRRPKFGQKAEAETLAQWLQVELGFQEGGQNR